MMKTIKKAFLLIVFFLIGAISQTMAQPMNCTGMNTPGIQYLMTEYGDELNLSDAQKNDLIALQMAHRNQFRSNGAMWRGNRSGFQRGFNGRRGAKGQGFRNADPQFMQARFDSRMQMRQQVLDILTDEQLELLQSQMIDKAEKAHEFRTFRHQYMVEQAGIEGEKAEQILNLLNARSESRVQWQQQRFLNPQELNSDLIADHFQQMRDTDDELRSILTVDEYESLRNNMGFANCSFQRQAPRGRRWSR